MKKFKVITISIICFCSFLKAEIIKIDDFTHIEKALAKVNPQEALVILDVDEVIITPQNQIFKRKYRDESKKLYSNLQEKLSKEKFEKISHIMADGALSRQLVDPDLPKLLKKLKSDNIRIFALTAYQTGEAKGRKSREDIRIDELSALDIDFKKLSNTNQHKIFEIVNCEHGKIVLKDGIIFSSGVDKGFALAYVLHFLKEHPKKIIFIDDQRLNLESVGKYCSDMEIEFIGFEYSGAEKLCKEPFNLNRATLQFDYLEKQERWLSDAEADKKLKNRTR